MLRHHFSRPTVAVGMLLLWPCVTTPAIALNCNVASTSVDKVICKSSELTKRDDKMVEMYKYLLQVARPETAPVLRKQQEEWARYRNKKCRSSPAVSCLVILYDQRIEELTALESISYTEKNSELDSVDYIIFKGQWHASAYSPSVSSLQSIKQSDIDRLSSQENLPRPGDAISGTAEGLCISDLPCEAVSWKQTTAQTYFGTGVLKGEPHIIPGTKIMVGRREKNLRAPVVLLPTSDGNYNMMISACGEPRGGCATTFMPWVKNKDAQVNVIHPKRWDALGK